MFKALIGTIAKSASSIFGSWTKMKTSKYEAEAAYNLKSLEGEQDWDLAAQRNMKSSLKDELIMIIWFSPMYASWYNSEDNRISTANEWVAAVNALPYWWWFGAFGILAATFGLRWYFKQQNFNVAGMKKSGE